MQHWKRTILHTGVSLSALGGATCIAAGTASAHDATDPAVPAVPAVPAHHGPFHRSVQGVVATVGAGSFTITTHKGTTKTIDTTLTTSYSETGTPVAPTGVAMGQDVVVALDPADATPTAVRVTVLLDRVSGKVLDVGSASITLAGPKGTTRDAVISSGTLYFNGKTAATGVTVGEFVTAFGTKDTTTPTEIDALFVDIYPTSVHPGGGPLVTPTVTPPVGPRLGDKGNGWSTQGHAPTTLPTVPATDPATPTGGSFGHGGPGLSGQGNQNDHGGNGGRGPGGLGSGGPSGGGNGSGGYGGRG